MAVVLAETVAVAFAVGVEAMAAVTVAVVAVGRVNDA